MALRQGEGHAMLLHLATRMHTHTHTQMGLDLATRLGASQNAEVCILPFVTHTTHNVRSCKHQHKIRSCKRQQTPTTM